MASHAGHLTRLREEIVSCITEFLEENDQPLSRLDSPTMVKYINDQISRVFAGMCQVPSNDQFHPSNVDDRTVDADYYRESIAEFGTVYIDYRLD